MVNRETIVKAETGIGAKQAAELVQICSGYKSEIFLKQGGKKVNAKSIMGVISMSLKMDENVTVVVIGEDETDALSAVLGYFNKL